VNDPHVNALHYRVVEGKTVDYNNASPISEITEDFEFYLNGKTAIFKMKEHYSTANEAKAVVEQYLRAWDILSGLEQEPDCFRLVFHHADIIDRSPSKKDASVINLRVHISNHAVASDNVSIHISMDKYPPFPKGFSASPDAETMYLRYKAYRQNRETLTSMAYMCLTVLEASAGSRRKAARKYNIEFTVLDTLGRLASTKGNTTEVRKFPDNGMFVPLSPKEKDWILSVIKALIRRVGEYSHDPGAKHRHLSMRDFPDLASP